MEIKKAVPLIFLFVLLMLTLLTGCTSSGKGGPLQLNPTVLTCGEYNTMVYQACYWEGQSQMKLPIAGISQANSIQYHQGFIYIGGTDNGDPRLWKNQFINSFPQESNGQVLAIFINNNVIYSAGVIGSSPNFLPCYWENGMIKYLDLGVYTYGQVNSIYIENNNIYCGGSVNDGFSDKPCYWKNDSEPYVIGTYSNAQIKSLYVLNGTVYSCFNHGISSYSCVNQNEQELPHFEENISNAIYCTSIAVSGGVVYIGGKCNDGVKNSPCYWKGPELIVLDSKGQEGAVNTITVFNGKLYAGGLYNNGASSLPCYWEDGKLNDLPNIYSNSAQVYGIWVGYK